MVTPMERLWTGATIVCAASGPSLSAADLEAVRAVGLPVIAVNDAIELAPWADVLYSSDRSWWKSQWKGHKRLSFDGLKVSIGTLAGQAEPYPSKFGVQVLTNTGDRGLECDPSGLRSGRNSGYAAVNLAVHLGASTILLLGYNMGRVDGQSHFHGRRPSIQSPYRMFLDHFRTMVEPLKSAGVRVINCTAQTALQCFPIGDVREIVSDRATVAA